MPFNSVSIADAREYVVRASEKIAKVLEHAQEAIDQGIQVFAVLSDAVTDLERGRRR